MDQGERRESPEIEREAMKHQAIIDLKNRGIEANFGYARKLQTPETDLQGNEIKTQSYWVRFPQAEDFEGSGDVEGKIYLPEDSNGEAVILAPGFPGGAAGRLEKTYAGALVAKGYTVVCLRHNGTFIAHEGEEAEKIINCPERQEDARVEGRTNLVEDKPGGYLWTDLTRETIAPFVVLAKSFKKIHLVGNSFGAAMNMISLGEIAKRRPDLIDRAGNFVSLAGYLGKAKALETGNYHGIRPEWPVKKFIDAEIADAEENHVHLAKDSQAFQESLEGIPKQLEQVNFPPEVNQILVVASNDPLIAEPVVREEATEEGRPGRVVGYDSPGQSERLLYIRDETQTKKAHTLPNLRSENLIRGLRMRVAHGVHSATVRSMEPRTFVDEQGIPQPARIPTWKEGVDEPLPGSFWERWRRRRKEHQESTEQNKPRE